MKNGFGDLRVIIGNEEIRTFKFLLYVCNETLRKLLENPLFEEPLMLSENCSKTSFFLLEKYYEGIEIDVNEKNCVDLLSLCVYYNEESLLSNVVDYITNHLNEEIIINLLNKKEILNNEKLKELKDKFDDFIKNKNYKLMNEDLLKYIDVDNMKYLFSNGRMFNGNEIDLLKLLLDYYKNNIRERREKEEMKILIEKCGFKKELLSELTE